MDLAPDVWLPSNPYGGTSHSAWSTLGWYPCFAPHSRIDRRFQPSFSLLSGSHLAPLILLVRGWCSNIPAMFSPAKVIVAYRSSQREI